MYNKREVSIFNKVKKVSDKIIGITQVQKTVYLKFDPSTDDAEIERIWNEAKGRLNLRICEISLKNAGIFDRIDYSKYKKVRLGR